MLYVVAAIDFLHYVVAVAAFLEILFLDQLFGDSDMLRYATWSFMSSSSAGSACLSQALSTGK